MIKIKNIANYLPVIALLFALTACETTSQQEIKVDNAQPTSIKFPAPDSSYGALPNYDNQIQNASTGSVTIYSLDGAPPAIASQVTRDMTPYPTAASSSSYYNNSAPMSYRGTRNTDEQIFFKFGSSRLGSGDENKISRFAEKAKFAPINHVTVEGYASRPTQAGTGTVEAHILNLKQSMNRSFAVSKSLMRKGLPNEKIKTVSHGSANATGDEQQDRRVDMFMGDR